MNGGGGKVGGRGKALISPRLVCFGLMTAWQLIIANHQRTNCIVKEGVGSGRRRGDYHAQEAKEQEKAAVE